MISRRWFVVCWLSLGMIIAYVDRVNLTSAMPLLGGDLKLDAEQRGMAMSAFFWTYTIGQIPAGMLVDRRGVRLLYAAGITLWSLASALTVFATGLWSLVITRWVVGLGESVVTSSSLRYIRAHFQEKERGFAVGVYMTGTKIGPAIGFPLAGWLVANYGWQAMFLCMGLGSMLWLGPWMATVPSTDPAAQPATPGVKSESYTLSQALSTKAMWGIILGTYCYMYFVYYCMTWMPEYFQKAHNMSIKDSNWFVGASFGGMAMVAALGGWAADRWIARGAEPIFVRRVFTIAGFVMAAMQTLSVFTTSQPLMIGITVAALCGLGLATANYWALTTTLMPGAVPVAIQNTAANLAGIVAPWLTGWMIKKTGSFEAPIMAVGVWLLLGIFSYAVLVRKTTVAQTEPVLQGR